MILTSKQAHFWERYALNVNDITDKKDPDGMKHFEERVLDVITGEGSKDKETIGPAVDWKLFNGDCDDTSHFHVAVERQLGHYSQVQEKA